MPAGKPHKPQAFIAARGPKGWRVKTQQTWRHARELSILAPVLAGPDGLIRGEGVVRPARRGVIVILG